MMRSFVQDVIIQQFIKLKYKLMKDLLKYNFLSFLLTIVFIVFIQIDVKIIISRSLILYIMKKITIKKKQHISIHSYHTRKGRKFIMKNLWLGWVCILTFFGERV